jgi:hypothetical protein
MARCISILGQDSEPAIDTDFASATSILSLSKDAVPGQKRPFSRPVTLRQALRKHPERSGGQRDYVRAVRPQSEMRR